MHAPATGDRKTAPLAAIAMITAAAFLLQAANGLFQALLPLRMQAQDLSITAIGGVATSFGLGFAAGCFLAPHLVRNVGHIRAYASLAAVLASAVLAFDVAEGALAWFALRAVTGVALAGLFTVIDSWVGAAAGAADRGRVIAVYSTAVKLALVLSPLGVGLGAVTGSGLIMLIAAAMALSLVPICATPTREPRAPTLVTVRIRPLFQLAPSAAAGAVAVGLINSPVVAVAPVYGLAVGLSAERAALLLLALQAGSLLFQWPLGWLSDRIDRRIVIAGLFAAAALVCAAILAAPALGGELALIAAFGLYGGIALCIYAVCVAHACDLVAPEEIVPTVSSLLVCWAAGATLGPLPATWLMDAAGPQALFWYVGAIASALAVFVLVRIRVRSRDAAGAGFVNVLATSPATGDLAGETLASTRDGDGATPAPR